MKNRSHEWTRRKFIASITSAGTMMMASPLFSWAIEDIDPRVAALVASTIGIDTHNHIDVPLIAGELPGPKVDMLNDMKQSGLSAICMTFALDYQKMTTHGEAYTRFMTGLDAMDKMLESNKIKRSVNLADISNAHNKNTPTVIQSIEGGHFLEGKLDRLGVAYGRGLRHLGLLHDSDASTPLGDVYTNAAQWGGLTAFGAEIIHEANRLGILVDLAHASPETVDAALKVTSCPVIISHTGLDSQLGQNPNMARMMRPRLISKERAKVIADAGGVIGVWTHLSDSPLGYAQNIKALVEVVGVEHVCIGTDTKLTTPYRSPGAGFNPKSGTPPPGGDQQNGAPAVNNNQNGAGINNRPGAAPPDNGKQSGAGTGNNRARVGERTNEAWQDQKVGFYFAVVDALLKIGFTENEIGKIGGGNFCRVFNAATTGH